MTSANANSSSHEGRTRAPNYACLESTIVLLCGYAEQQLAQLRQLVLELGGKVQLKPAIPASAHVIVADSVISHQYRDARRCCSHVPAVTSAWLRECYRTKRQVNKEPYCLKALTGCIISTTNFQNTSRLAAQQFVAENGGIYSAELIKDACTHLVCAVAGGSKYNAAVYDWGMRNVVSWAWVEDSCRQGFPVDEAAYMVRNDAPSCQPAAAVVPTAHVTLPPPQPVAPAAMLGPGTGLSAAKQQAPSSSTGQGASAAASAVAAVATGNPGSSRGRRTRAQAAAAAASTAAAADMHQLHSHHHQPPPQQQQQQQCSGDPAPAKAASSSPRDVTGAAFEPEEAVAAAMLPAGTAAAAAAAGAATLTVADSGGGASRSNSSWLLPDVTEADEVPLVAAGDLVAPPQQPLLLERVVLWCCGLPPGSPELAEMWGIMGQYSGTVYPDLCGAVTHILVGLMADASELQAVRDHVSTTPHLVHLVKPQWLRLCHHQQQLLPLPDPRCSLSLEALQQRCARAAAAAAGDTAGTAAAAAAGVAAGLGAQRPAGRGAGAAPGVFAPAAGYHAASAAAAAAREQAAADAAAAAVLAAAAVADTAPQYWLQPPADPAHVFEGCWFTLVAVTGAPFEGTVVDSIKQAGGKVFTSPQQVPPCAAKVFAVCPDALPASRLQQLQGSSAAWRLVHPTCRVTRAWVGACRKIGALQRITPRSPLWSPLSHEVPLASFTTCIISCSGFAAEKRDTISRLVQLLGATYEDNMRRGLTHLIVPQLGTVEGVEGYGSESLIKKCHRASTWGVCLVTPSWLLECAAAGRRLAEEEFMPAGQLPVAAPGGGGALASQLPATQAAKARSTQAAAAATQQHASRLKHNSSSTQQQQQAAAASALPAVPVAATHMQQQHSGGLSGQPSSPLDGAEHPQRQSSAGREQLAAADRSIEPLAELSNQQQLLPGTAGDGKLPGPAHAPSTATPQQGPNTAEAAEGNGGGQAWSSEVSAAAAPPPLAAAAAAVAAAPGPGSAAAAGGGGGGGPAPGSRGRRSLLSARAAGAARTNQQQQQPGASNSSSGAAGGALLPPAAPPPAPPAAAAALAAGASTSLPAAAAAAAGVGVEAAAGVGAEDSQAEGMWASLDQVVEKATCRGSKLGSQQLQEVAPAASGLVNPMAAALRNIQRQAAAQQAAAGSGGVAGGGGGAGSGQLVRMGSGSGGEGPGGLTRGAKRARLAGEVGVMPPPSGLIGAGGGGSGGGSGAGTLRGSGGRYGTRGAAAAAAEVLDDSYLDQPSQQVGYEVGQQPAERLRARQAGAGSRRGTK